MIIIIIIIKIMKENNNTVVRGYQSPNGDNKLTTKIPRSSIY